MKRNGVALLLLGCGLIGALQAAASLGILSRSAVKPETMDTATPSQVTVSRPHPGEPSPAGSRPSGPWGGTRSSPGDALDSDTTQLSIAAEALQGRGDLSSSADANGGLTKNPGGAPPEAARASSDTQRAGLGSTGAGSLDSFSGFSGSAIPDALSSGAPGSQTLLGPVQAEAGGSSGPGSYAQTATTVPEAGNTLLLLVLSLAGMTIARQGSWCQAGRL